MSPTLDLTVAMRNLSADVAAVFAPGFAADGVLRGEAHFTGTPTRPEGKIQLAATGLRLRSGPGRALPAANVTASADLAGIGARIEARLTAGPMATLSVSGQLATAPSAPIDLHAVGALDLAMLNPLLTAEGRRTTGQIMLDARVGGNIARAADQWCGPAGERRDRGLRSGRAHHRHHRADRSRRKHHQADPPARPGGAGNDRGQRLGRYFGAGAAGQSGDHRAQRAPDGERPIDGGFQCRYAPARRGRRKTHRRRKDRRAARRDRHPEAHAGSGAGA